MPPSRLTVKETDNFLAGLEYCGDSYQPSREVVS